MIAIILFALEGFARVYYYVFFKGFRSTNIVIPSKIKGMDMEFKPNSEEMINGKLIRVNSYGFVDKDFSVRKNGFRVLTIGDSVTAGLGVPFEMRFSNILEKKLGVEVINAGFSGANTKYEFLLFETKGLPLKPDLVLVSICLNDYATSHAESFFKNGKFYWKEKHIVGFWQPIYDHFAFVRMLYNRGRKIKCLLLKKPEDPFAVSMPKLDKLERQRWEEQLSSFDSLCKEKKIRLVYVIFPARTVLGQRNSDPELTEYFNKKGLDYLDLITAFNKYKPDDLFLKKDLLHLTEKGHLVSAEAIYSYLKGRYNFQKEASITLSNAS